MHCNSLLFDLPTPASAAPTPRRREELDQYFTPVWAARALFAAHFSHLGHDDLVLEPSCGPGRMLRAIPAHIGALGVEIDPALAEQARTDTGRTVLAGGIFEVPLPRVTAVFGNPPFKVDFLERLLERLTQVVPMGAKVGLLVPAYFLQTPSTVLRYNRAWSIASEGLPRTLFPNLSKPLVFASFTRDSQPTLSGLRLFLEARAIEDLGEEAQRILREGVGTWGAVVSAALRTLGGRAHLSSLYHAIGQSGRKTGEHWRAKIRQVLQRGTRLFRPLGSGEWELCGEPA